MKWKTDRHSNSKAYSSRAPPTRRWEAETGESFLSVFGPASLSITAVHRRDPISNKREAGDQYLSHLASHLHTWVDMHTPAFTHTHTHPCTHSHTHGWTHMHTYAHTHLHLLANQPSWIGKGQARKRPHVKKNGGKYLRNNTKVVLWLLCVHVHNLPWTQHNTHSHTHSHIYTNTHSHTHSHTHIHTHTHTHSHTHTHTHTHT